MADIGSTPFRNHRRVFPAGAGPPDLPAAPTDAAGNSSPAPARRDPVPAGRPPSGPPATTGPVTGVTTGMSVGTDVRRFFGHRALLVTAALSTTLTLAVLLTSEPVSPWVVVAPGAVSLLLAAAYATDFGRWSGPLARVSVTARRFHLKPLTGGQLRCVWYGDDVPVGVTHGDLVTVTGRLAADDHYVVRRIEVLASPTGPVLRRIAPRRPYRLIIVRWLSRLCYGLTGVVLLWTLAALASGLS